MKHWQYFFILLSIFCFQLGEIWAESILVNTKSSGLNVRHQPKGKKIGRVFRGEQFVLLDKKKGWGKILFAYDRSGWISLNYTKKVIIQSTPISLVPFCKRLNKEFDRFDWSNIRCHSSEWQSEMRSVLGNPLIYTVVGNSEPTSLLLCSVHSDENTSFQCFRLLKHLKQHPEILNHRVVIAPIINPDGFLFKKRTRTNANKIDLNRNLPTKAWRSSAIRFWKNRYKSKKRRYPGKNSNSEPENQFLIYLIQHFNPDKIITIHAPMNFLDLDYDESVSSLSQRNILAKAQALALKFSKESRYQFRNYRTFIGSLGRYGAEWNMPIFTLELPSSDYHKSEQYFNGMKSSLFNSFNAILDPQRTARVAHDSSQFKVN